MRLEVTDSNLAQNEDYIYYKMWSQLFTTVIIPGSILTVSNLTIFYKLWQNDKLMKCSRNYSQKGKPNGSIEKQKRSAKMLAAVVIKFAICNSFRVAMVSFDIWTFEQNSFCDQFGKDPTYPNWFYVIGTFNHLLSTVNSSGNFLIYTFFGSKFRKVLKKTFRISNISRPNSIENELKKKHIFFLEREYIYE